MCVFAVKGNRAILKVTWAGHLLAAVHSQGIRPWAANERLVSSELQAGTERIVA